MCIWLDWNKDSELLKLLINFKSSLIETILIVINIVNNINIRYLRVLLESEKKHKAVQ